MAQVADPLSLAAPVLPGSSFDPVEFSKGYRKDFFDKIEERNKRFSDLASQFETPGEWNPSVKGQLIDERNKIMDEGASMLAQGYDVTDIANPKSSQKARDYQTRWQKLISDTTANKAIENLVITAKQTALKDFQDKGEESTFDPEKSLENIKAVQGAKNLEEARKILAEKGDNLLVPREQYTKNIDEYVTKQLPNYVSPEKIEETVKKGGKEITEGWNNIAPEAMKDAMKKMYEGDPQLQKGIAKRMQTDPLTLPNETPQEYFYRNYGNARLKQKYYRESKPIEPKEVKEDTTTPKVVPAGEVKTQINTGTKGETFVVTGSNAMTFPSAKPMKVNVGVEAIDKATNKRVGISESGLKDAVDFTPMSTAEYYTLDKPYKVWYKGKSSSLPAGAIVPAKDVESGKFKNAVKRRFVEGVVKMQKTITSGDTDKITTYDKSILVPYDNIKNEMDAVYKLGEQLPTSNAYVLDGIGEVSYDDLKASGWTDADIAKLKQK